MPLEAGFPEGSLQAGCRAVVRAAECSAEDNRVDGIPGAVDGIPAAGDNVAVEIPAAADSSRDASHRRPR